MSLIKYNKNTMSNTVGVLYETGTTCIIRTSTI